MDRRPRSAVGRVKGAPGLRIESAGRVVPGQDQALQTYRAPLREDGNKLCLIPRTRLRLHLDQIRPHGLALRRESSVPLRRRVRSFHPLRCPCAASPREWRCHSLATRCSALGKTKRPRPVRGCSSRSISTACRERGTMCGVLVLVTVQRHSAPSKSMSAHSALRSSHFAQTLCCHGPHGSRGM